MDVSTVKSARTAAKRIFNRHIKKLNDSLDANDLHQLVEVRFQDLKKLWDDVQEKHENYVAALEGSKGEFDANAEHEWINELDRAYEGVVWKRLEYLKVIECARKEEEEKQIEITREQEAKLQKQENDRKIEQAARSREMEEIEFRQEVENLKVLISSEKEKSSPAVSVLEAARIDLKGQLERCKRAHGEYVTLLDTEKAHSEMDWITKYQDIYAQVNQEIGRMVQQKRDADNKAKGSGSMRLERMKLPSCLHLMVIYETTPPPPISRSDFERHILPELESDDKAAYILKSCLTGPPLYDVCNVDGYVKEMWKRLNEKYGQPSKLADIVVLDIKNLKTIRDGDDHTFLDLVNIVERGYYDLARIKMESEVSNNATVSLVEERLPRTIRREWSKEVNKAGSVVKPNDKFPGLLTFLQEQRKIIEYESSDLRSGGQSHKGQAYLTEGVEALNDESPEGGKAGRCLVHNSSTHSTADCRVFQEKLPEDKIRLLKEKQACWSCLKVGHRWSVSCNVRGKCNVNGCIKFHHPSLHLAHVQGIAFYTPTTSKGDNHTNPCILQVMKIKSSCDKDPLNVLWDGGATISLITFDKAKELNLSGESVKLSVVKVGGSKVEMQSSVYTLPLMDKTGNNIESESTRYRHE